MRASSASASPYLLLCLLVLLSSVLDTLGSTTVQGSNSAADASSSLRNGNSDGRLGLDVNENENENEEVKKEQQSQHRRLRRQQRQTAKEGEEELICRLTVIDTLVGVTPTAEEDKLSTEETSAAEDKSTNDPDKEWLSVMKHHEEDESNMHYACIPISDNQETDRLYSIALPNAILDSYINNITEGNLLVSIRGATIDDNDNQVLLNHQEEDDDNNGIHVIDRVPPRMRHLQEMQATTGTKEIFIVRVSTPDSTPTKSLKELQQGIISMNTVSFQSQFHACSFGRLQWKLAGGVDISLDQSVRNYKNPSMLLQAAQDAAKEKLNVQDLRKLADHVVFCQPPGRDDWIAVAAVNHWYSNFNNDWCLSLSALMHEIGHNLGLLHSGVGAVAYGDRSGFMGYGTSSETYPRKCFNGLKSWQLGWYQDRHFRVDPKEADFSTTVSLASFVDYKKATDSEPVVINIADRYFLMYNRAKGFNADTQAMEDLVTITENTPSWSNSRAGLDVGDKFTLSNFRSGQQLVVQVCSAKDGGSSRADIMIVSISLGGGQSSNCNINNVKEEHVPEPKDDKNNGNNNNNSNNNVKDDPAPAPKDDKNNGNNNNNNNVKDDPAPAPKDGKNNGSNNNNSNNNVKKEDPVPAPKDDKNNGSNNNNSNNKEDRDPAPPEDQSNGNINDNNSNFCDSLNTPCDDDSDCCSTNQRCLDRTGSTMCRYCRIAGQRCSRAIDCCRGLACNLMSGKCEA